MIKILLAASVALSFAACSSSTVIKSVPPGGKLYMNGALVGETPYTHSDTKIMGTATALQIKREGCKDFNTILTRNEKFQPGACAGGMFVLVPFLWVMGYNPEHTYELECSK